MNELRNLFVLSYPACNTCRLILTEVWLIELIECYVDDVRRTLVCFPKSLLDSSCQQRRNGSKSFLLQRNCPVLVSNWGAY